MRGASAHLSSGGKDGAPPSRTLLRTRAEAELWRRREVGHGGGPSAFSSSQGAVLVMDCGAASEAAGCVTRWIAPPPARPLARCLQWPRAPLCFPAWGVKRGISPSLQGMQGIQAWSLASWRWMQRTCHERSMERLEPPHPWILGTFSYSVVQRFSYSLFLCAFIWIKFFGNPFYSIFLCICRFNYSVNADLVFFLQNSSSKSIEFL